MENDLLVIDEKKDRSYTKTNSGMWIHFDLTKKVEKRLQQRLNTTMTFIVVVYSEGEIDLCVERQRSTRNLCISSSKIPPQWIKPGGCKVRIT